MLDIIIKFYKANQFLMTQSHQNKSKEATFFLTMQQPQLLGNHFDHKVAWWEATFLQTDVTQHKLRLPISAIEIYFINVNRLIANMVQSELVCTSDCNPTTTSLFGDQRMQLTCLPAVCILIIFIYEIKVTEKLHHFALQSATKSVFVDKFLNFISIQFYLHRASQQQRSLLCCNLQQSAWTECKQLL